MRKSGQRASYYETVDKRFTDFGGSIVVTVSIGPNDWGENLAANLQKLRVQFTVGDSVDALLRHLRGKLGSREDAEDIAQEAYLKFLQAAERGLEVRNPRAYLMTIAQNLLYHHYTSRAHSIVPSDVDVDTLYAEDPDLESSIGQALRADRVNRAWRELSPKCQQALLLRWRDGLRVKEICAEMDLSQGMVKKYLAQGLAHFRKRLGRFVDSGT